MRRRGSSTLVRARPRRVVSAGSGSDALFGERFDRVPAPPIRPRSVHARSQYGPMRSGDIPELIGPHQGATACLAWRLRPLHIASEASHGRDIDLERITRPDGDDVHHLGVSLVWQQPVNDPVACLVEVKLPTIAQVSGSPCVERLSKIRRLLQADERRPRIRPRSAPFGSTR